MFALGAVDSVSRRFGVVMTLLHQDQDTTFVMDANASASLKSRSSTGPIHELIAAACYLAVDHAVDCCLICTLATEP